MLSNKVGLACSFLPENLVYYMQEEDHEWMHTIQEEKVTLNSTVKLQVFNMARYCTHTKNRWIQVFSNLIYGPITSP
jgi:hypothetical protein